MHKVYKTVNWVAIFFAVYMLLLPFISPIMETVAPEIAKCSYKSINGEPCPFCGITTDFGSINSSGYNGNSASNSMSLFIYTLLVVEIGFRTILVFAHKKITNTKRIIYVDIIIHLALIIYFTVWTINWFKG